ncbi:cell division protein FtsK [Chelonobacter oris]|uniref:FtsK/SpoIIIE family DNA translocase n=1 Tax=Chelonobacter oris TaxID=505317 RepID=UPI00244BA4E1|nr:DNA translocase FtsK 4TM domain-containing protein [Chelonobacter oris]MDH3000692.1 cell division protein FtsK [Chelonobacter oris]
MIRNLRPKYTAKHYITEMILGSVALFGVYLIIAWSSYSPYDNAWTVASPQQEALNKAGAFGAWCIDMLFALFGSVANFLPFVLVISSVLLLRSKWRDQFSKGRLFVRLLGFLLLLCGLTALAALLLSNTDTYLAGGVLGGWLIKTIYPTFGMFGSFMAAFCMAIIGFILSSGMSLVMLLVSAYQWLTAKYEDEEAASVDNGELEPTPSVPPPVEQLEEVILPESVLRAREAAAKRLEEAKATTEVDGESAVSERVIVGLSPSSAQAQTALTNQDNPAQLSLRETQDLPDFGRYQIEQTPELPKVSINLPPQTTPNATDSSLSVPNIDGVPKVSLSNANLANDAEQVRFDVDDDGRDDDLDQSLNDELARQFAEREQQRLQAMQAQAKALNAEKELQVILNNEIEPADVEAQSNGVPNYKPYENSLIHPLLQPKVSHKGKPSTPLPSLDLLEQRKAEEQDISREEIDETSSQIEHQLRNFNVKAKVQSVLVGPVVTRYELELEPGTKASKVSGLDTDLARALMFRSIRVAEVIPGKPYIGIETPNLRRQTVSLRDVLSSVPFQQSTAILPLALGKDISGEPIVVDLAKMPHLLVAGSTGSGKSVGVNSMILSLLFKRKPEDVRFIMIDPKVVELSIYNDIPHLLTEVVTDMKKAANALRWCVDEMERRYQLLSSLYVRNIEGFNGKIDEAEAMNLPIPNPTWRPGDTMDSMPPALEKLSYIVVIIDEFADLLMVAGKQVEELIARLAQKARAVGIHLILATQRPSVDVITGLIKANIPSRIAFTVTSKIDSRTILDQGGAEALLGRGDMLYSGQGSSELIRVHGAFMSDEEVSKVADDWRARGKPQYLDEIVVSQEEENGESAVGGGTDELDDLFDSVTEYVLTTGNTSISSIQRNFKLGFNRAARIVDQMEAQGIVSAASNGKREILASRQNYE